MSRCPAALGGPTTWGRAVSAIAVALLATVFAATGCSRSPPPMQLRKVLVDVAVDPEGVPAGGVSREAVRDIVERALARVETIERNDGHEGLVLRVLVDERRGNSSPAAEGEGRGLRLSVELRSEASRVDDPQTDLRAEAAVPWPEQSAAGDGLSRGLEAAFGEALAQLVTAHGAGALADDVLVAWLGDAAVARPQRLEACRVLGARRAAAAAPAFVNLLREDDVELAIVALRGLSALGAQGFADAIIDFSEGKAAAVRVHAIEALQENPGPRVRAWLFTLSTGHPEAEVRTAAERVLARVEPSVDEPEAVENAGMRRAPE